MPMPGAAVQEALVASRSLPLAVQDTQTPPGPPRGGRFGEQAVWNPMPYGLSAADEGTLIIASIAPGATAINFGINASYSTTVAQVVLFNGDNPSNPNARRIFPRKLHFTCSGAPTSAAAAQYTTVLDNINRQPTNLTGGGNTAITATSAYAFAAVANNTNMSNSNPVLGRCYFPCSASAWLPPAVPAPGPAARTLIGQGYLRYQIPVAGDDYNIIFGAIDDVAPTLVTAAPAGYSRIVVPHEAVAIDPGQSFLVNIWFPSNVTAGFIAAQMDMSWVER